MKVLVCLGTRPEIIRLSQIIPKLDKACDMVLLDTGQNYDANMSQVFYDELNIKRPDVHLDVGNKPGPLQVSAVIEGTYRAIEKYKPDRMLVLGDTNSGMVAYAAARMGVKVYHMEAGNRCFDRNVPEEVNRLAIDSVSDEWMPYSERSRQNLLAEGKPSNRIFVTGNPILEVLHRMTQDIHEAQYVPKEINQDSSDYHMLSVLQEDRFPSINPETVLKSLGLGSTPYVLVTAHRQENVDDVMRLTKILNSCAELAKKYHVIFSRHPRTKKNMEEWYKGMTWENIKFHEPFGFKDFLALERNATCVITDSGTVSEECAILNVPSVVIRDVTERPEIIECGASILSGVEPESILRCFNLVMSQGTNWTVPPEYLRENVSDTVVRILTGV